MENPIYYRWWLNQRKGSLWSHFARWLIYPTLIGVTQLGQRHGDVFVLAIFLHFLYFCGGAIYQAAKTLGEERRRRTFDCLLTSGLSSSQWLSSLFITVAGPRLLELLVFLPLWVYFFLKKSPVGDCFGHRPELWQTALWTLSLLGLTALSICAYTSFGLWLSSRSRSSAVAQLWAVLTVVVTFLMVIAVDAVLLSPITGRGEPYFSSIVSPWIGFMMAFERHSSGIPCSPLLLATFHGAVARVAYRKALELLERPPVNPSNSANESRSQLKGWDNPLLYRAVLALSRRRSKLLSLLICPAVVCGFLAFGRLAGQFQRKFVDVEATLYFSVATVLLVLTAHAVASTNTAFAEERENGTFEILLGTQQTPQAIFWTKTAALMAWPALQCLLCGPLFYLFESPRSEYSPYHVGLLNLLIWGWMAMCHSLALYNSCGANSGATALTKSTALLCTVVIGLPTLAVAMGHQSWAGISPLFAIINLAEGHTAQTLGVVTLYALAGLGLTVGASLRFPRECLKQATARF